MKNKFKMFLIAVLFLIGHAFYISSYSIAPPKHIRVNYEITQLREKVDFYHRVYGKLPISLKMFQDKLGEQFIDPWGYKYIYQTSGSEFTLSSKGQHEYELTKRKSGFK